MNERLDYSRRNAGSLKLQLTTRPSVVGISDDILPFFEEEKRFITPLPLGLLDKSELKSLRFVILLGLTSQKGDNTSSRTGSNCVCFLTFN